VEPDESNAPDPLFGQGYTLLEDKPDGSGSGGNVSSKCNFAKITGWLTT
jgi:hypothetical protein